MFFDDLSGLIRVAVLGITAYVAIVLLLRITGKRTLSKMNAFDFVVTIALGSMLATILLSKDVPLLEGVFALFILMALQNAVTWMSVRSSRFRSWVKAEPQTLLRDGQFVEDAMRRERVTRDEIMAATRKAGHAEPARMRLITLETDGSISVVPG